MRRALPLFVAFTWGVSCATYGRTVLEESSSPDAGGGASAEAQALGAEAEQARAELERARAERDEALARVEALDRRLAASDHRIASLAESFAAARSEADLFRRKWEGSAVDRVLLGEWISGDEGAIRDRFEDACRELIAVREERETLCRRLGDLLAALENDEALRAAGVTVRGEMAAAQSALGEVGRAQVRRAAVVERPASVPGSRVLSVNPELNVVVLTVGGADGVQPGMEMNILRADEPVARVRVVETRDRVCAAVIQDVEDATGPRVGDLARVARSGS